MGYEEWVGLELFITATAFEGILRWVKLPPVATPVICIFKASRAISTRIFSQGRVTSEVYFKSTHGFKLFFANFTLVRFSFPTEATAPFPNFFGHRSPRLSILTLWPRSLGSFRSYLTLPSFTILAFSRVKYCPFGSCSSL